jgi:glycosyltransferase involved in cell wall biosynthesis
MNIFFISYWGVNDGLSVSTSQPNLRLIAEREDVKQIYYFTVERQDATAATFQPVQLDIAKTQHIPIVSRPLFLRPLTKFADLWRIWSKIKAIAQNHRPDLIICRGAITAMFGYWLSQKTGAPYIVESFEPHADYMYESGVWSRNGLAYQIERRYEQKAKQTASALVTVSHNYEQELINVEKLPAEKIYVVPCTVQLDTFAPNEEQRAELRIRLDIAPEERVGIYVGKFGSIYYDAEAFDLFKAAYNFFGGQFRLLLLSPTPVAELQQKLARVGFPLDKAFITCAPHAEVPHYLAAADFAFSPIRPADCRRFCSPIKDGEYWAAGLPFLIPDGVGDDSDIIRAAGYGGAIFDAKNPMSVVSALQSIAEQISQTNYRQEVRQLAIEHRHFDIQRRVYEAIFSTIPLKK